MTPRRYELSDFEWSIIEPLLPNKPRGVKRSDDRKVLNGIYWRLRTGSPWAEIPDRLRTADDLLQSLRAVGLPILLKLTPGQAHDGRSADDMLAGLVQGQILLADRGYDSDDLRARLAKTRRMGQHQADAQPGERPLLQPLSLPLPQSRRMLL